MQKTKFSPDDQLLRIPQVLSILGIGRSTWYAGISKGIFPAPLKLGLKTSVWPRSQICAIVDNLTARQDVNSTENWVASPTKQKQQ